MARIRSLLSLLSSQPNNSAALFFTLVASPELLSIYDTLYVLASRGETKKKDKKFVVREFTRLLATDNIVDLTLAQSKFFSAFFAQVRAT